MKDDKSDSRRVSRKSTWFPRVRKWWNSWCARHAWPESRNIKLLAALLCIVGVGTIYYSSMSIQQTVWKDFFVAVGSALFITGLVSMSIEFKDFVAYTSRVLKAQLIDHEYLKRLVPEERELISREIDLIALEAPGGEYYEFLREHFEEMKSVPYRRDFHDSSDYVIIPGHPEVLRKKTKTKYYLVKGFSKTGRDRTEHKMRVRWEGDWLLEPKYSKQKSDYVEEIALTIKKDNKVIDSFKMSKDQMSFLNNSQGKLDIDSRTERSGRKLHLESTTKEETNKVGLKYEYEIPGGEQFAHDEFVHCEIVKT